MVCVVPLAEKKRIEEREKAQLYVDYVNVRPESLSQQRCEAAETLGARPFQIFRRITLPAIRWAVAYGVVLTTARVIGEFGAVSAVAGTKLTLPLYVRAEVENFDTSGAYAASVVLALIAIATVVVLRAFHPREETG